MEVSGKLHDLATLPQGKEPLVLGGPQSQYGHSSEEKNSQPLLGLEPPSHPAHRV